MRKIPTVFVRDPDNRKALLPVPHDSCRWVLEGERAATRKYDGTCVLLDDEGRWWQRREVKAGRHVPLEFLEMEFDAVTGKRFGWIPMGTGGFSSALDDALQVNGGHEWTPGTYELIGPKISGNPEKAERHDLVMHRLAETIDIQAMHVDFDSLRRLVIYMHDTYGWEGIVFHHPDGRMAKLKNRDFRASDGTSWETVDIERKDPA